MHNLNRSRKPSEQESLNNLSIVEDYVDSVCYSKWVPASALVGGVVLGNLDSVAVGEFAEGLDIEGRYTFKKPTKWDNGMIGIKIHYTGTYDAGNSIYVHYSISAIDSGETIPAAPFDSLIQIPTPVATGAYTIYDGTNVSVSNLYAVNENDRAIAFAFKRNGSHVKDTYTDIFKLIGIDIIYKESSKQSTSKFSPNDKTK